MTKNSDHRREKMRIVFVIFSLNVFRSMCFLIWQKQSWVMYPLLMEVAIIRLPTGVGGRRRRPRSGIRYQTLFIQMIVNTPTTAQHLSSGVLLHSVLNKLLFYLLCFKIKIQTRPMVQQSQAMHEFI